MLRKAFSAIRLIFTVLTLGLALLPTTHARPQQRGVRIQAQDGKTIDLYNASYALVVGVSDYTAGWPKLPGVRKDVEAVSRTLEKQGFQVTLVENPDSAHLEGAFRDFIDRHGMDVNNRLLFYFAGHGHTIKQSYGEEMGYIVPTDAPNPNQDQAGFRRRAMDMQQMELYARRIQAKHALFLFDSCFSGALFALTRAVPDSISYKTSRPVRQFITSGSADEQVPDVSVFRHQFIDALEGEADRNRDGYVTGSELGEYLQDTVVNYTRNAQHPQYGKIRNPNLDKGDFVFVLPKATLTPVAVSGSSQPNQPAVPVDNAALDLAFWNSIQHSTDPEDYKAYLEKFPQGIYAALAHRRARPATTAAAVPESTPKSTENSSTEVERHLRRGIDLVNSGQAAEAEPALREALRLAPDNHAAHFHLARSLNNQRKDEESLKGAKQALSLARSEGEKFLYQGYLLNEEDKYAEAESQLREAIKLNPNNVDVHHTLFNALMGQRKYPEAEETAKRVLALDSKHTLARSGLGRALLNQKKYVDAEAACREAIRLNPKYPGHHMNLGLVLDRQGKYTEAEAELTEALRLDPKNSSAYAHRGTIYNQQGRYDQAIADFNEAIRLDPKNSNVYVNRGASYSRKGQYDQAITDFNEAIRLDPKYSFAYASRCRTHGQKNQDDRALSDCTEAIRLDPKSTYAYAGRSSVYLRKRKYDQAVADATEAIRLDPQHSFAYRLRGEAFRLQDKYDQAISDLTEAIRIAPKDPAPYAVRGTAYRQKGVYDQAITDLSEAIRLEPNYVWALKVRVETYKKMGDKVRAAADERTIRELEKKK